MPFCELIFAPAMPVSSAKISNLSGENELQKLDITKMSVAGADYDLEAIKFLLKKSSF